MDTKCNVRLCNPVNLDIWSFRFLKTGHDRSMLPDMLYMDTLFWDGKTRYELDLWSKELDLILKKRPLEIRGLLFGELKVYVSFFLIF